MCQRIRPDSRGRQPVACPMSFCARNCVPGSRRVWLRDWRRPCIYSTRSTARWAEAGSACLLFPLSLAFAAACAGPLILRCVRGRVYVRYWENRGFKCSRTASPAVYPYGTCPLPRTGGTARGRKQTRSRCGGQASPVRNKDAAWDRIAAVEIDGDERRV